MVAVPAAIPVTVPVLLTVATAMLLLLQVPPAAAIASLNVVVVPAHRVVAPDMLPAFGSVLTVTTVVVTAVPQALLTA